MLGRYLHEKIPIFLHYTYDFFYHAIPGINDELTSGFWDVRKGSLALENRKLLDILHSTFLITDTTVLSIYYIIIILLTK